MDVQSGSFEEQNTTSPSDSTDAELNNALLAAMRLWEAEAKERLALEHLNILEWLAPEEAAH